MKTHFKKVALAVFAPLCSISFLSGCSFGGGANALTITVHKAGYGDAFLKYLIEAYNDSVDEEDELKVSVRSSSTATQAFQNELEAESNLADIYMVLDTNWSNYAITGKLASLEDVFKDVEDVMDPDIAEGCRIKVGDTNHPYVVPWTAGPSGLVYNKTLFDSKGWEVPTTVSELKALFKTIEADPDVKYPISFSPADIAYLEYLLDTWWIQVDGLESWKNFWKFENKDVFQSRGRNVALDTFYNLFYDFNAQTGQWVQDTNAFKQYDDLSQAELAVVNGEAAMMVNQSCFYNEMKSEIRKLDNANFQMMETPLVEKSFIMNNTNTPGIYDAWDGTLATDSVAYCPTWDIIVVPEKATNKENAMKFLKFINTSEANKIFAKRADIVRPIKNCDPSKVQGVSTFLKSCSKISDDNTVVQKLISAPMYYVNAGPLSAWPNQNKPWFVFTTTTSARKMNVSEYKNDMNEYVNREWDGWVEKAERAG